MRMHMSEEVCVHVSERPVREEVRARGSVHVSEDACARRCACERGRMRARERPVRKCVREVVRMRMRTHARMRA